MPFRSVNPATEEVLREFASFSKREVDGVLDRLDAASAQTCSSGFEVRAANLRALGQTLLRERNELATLLTQEMGKLRSAAVAEIEKCAALCEQAPRDVSRVLASDLFQSKLGRIVFRPYGVILAVMPFNYPFWQVFRVAATAILLGNTIALKHAESTTLAAMRIEELFRSHFSSDVLLHLRSEVADLAGIIADPRVHAVTLTGGEKAGSNVARMAGENVKKCVLELGGVDPMIITQHAKLDTAVDLALRARFQNNGQACIATKRLYVHESILGTMLERLRDKLAAFRIGDPIDAKTDLGPLAKSGAKEALQAQKKAFVDAGASVVYESTSLPKRGYFAPATLLTGVPHTLLEANEAFGPLLAVEKYDALHRLIPLLNFSPTLLGVSVISGNRDECDYAAQNLEVATVAINRIVASDPALPFGGRKRSGFGRELGVGGVLEWATMQTVLT